MKTNTPYPPSNYTITYDSSLVPNWSSVIFVAKNNKLAISTVALASALNTHGIRYICASYPGKCEQLDLALGAENVVNLPICALNPHSPEFCRLIQCAREQRAVLIIDAEVPPSFKFRQLPHVMQLRRGDMLTIMLSMVGDGKKIPDMESVRDCRSEYCVLHVLESDPGNLNDEGIKDTWQLPPTWYSGEITDGMLNVLARSGPYACLPSIPHLPGIFYNTPDCWIHHDDTVKAVVNMLENARENIWDSLSDTFRCVIM